MLSTYSVCTAKKTDIRSSDRKSKASFGQMSGRRFTFFSCVAGWENPLRLERVRCGFSGMLVGAGGWKRGLPKGASGRSRRFFAAGRLACGRTLCRWTTDGGWIGELAPCAGRSVKALSTLGKTILTLENSILTLEKTVSTSFLGIFTLRLSKSIVLCLFLAIFLVNSHQDS